MAWVARRHLGGSPSEADTIRATTEAIGDLLNSGHAIVGDVVKDQGLLCVRSWELSTADTVKRIEDEWRALGHLPDLGEVCWLELTDSGRGQAREWYRPRYRIHRGTLYVWFGGQQSAERHDFDCLLDVTEAGEFVGVEILDCRRQLVGVTFPPAYASDTTQWSYDAGHDTFHLRLARPDGLVQKKSSGVARVDGQRSFLSMEVVLGDRVVSDDRDLTFLVAAE
jgi:hypothetical protein